MYSKIKFIKSLFIVQCVILLWLHKQDLLIRILRLYLKVKVQHLNQPFTNNRMMNLWRKYKISEI